jgi:hypothetical protein
VKRVLLVAFHFPPYDSSSGLHRTLSLAHYLPRFGWEPLVLTAHTRAYGKPKSAPDPTSASNSLVVRRACAFDAARHFSVRGRYPGALALPDRWSSWFLGAVPAGLGMIRKYKPALIWTTYPLATAHSIGAALSRLSGLPWIADFRDPMVECIDGHWFPENEAVRRARLTIERRVAQRARGATFCTDSASTIFSERHAAAGAPVCRVIENGYDPGAFDAAAAASAPPRPGALHLVHSGTLYPGLDRDPSSFLRAIARLRERGQWPKHAHVTLRATGFDAVYRPTIEQLRLGDCVSLAPAVDYATALREMLEADGLLLFQGRTSNPAVPAKAYEYLRARRPILALLDDDGETAALLRRAGVGTLAPINDVDRIEAALATFVTNLARGAHRVLDEAGSEAFSRIHRVREFAGFFAQIAA